MCCEIGDYEIVDAIFNYQFSHEGNNHNNLVIYKIKECLFESENNNSNNILDYLLNKKKII